MSTDSSSDSSGSSRNFKIHLSSVLMDHLFLPPEQASDRNGTDSEASDLVSSSSGEEGSQPGISSPPPSPPTDGEETADEVESSSSRESQQKCEDDAAHPSCSRNRNKTVSDSSEGKESASGTDDVQAGWTISEDALLRGMKDESTENVSWADIATALGRTKNDVKGRWKVIKDGEAGDAEAGDDGQGKGNHNRNRNRNRKAKAKAKHQEVQTTKTSSTNNSSSAQTREANTSPKERRQDAESCESPHLRIHHHHDDHNHGNDETESEADEHVLQKRYLYRDIYGSLYPPTLDLTPDGILNKEDCATLATIASKYEQNRLLEMQANFMNAAGRKVPISYLRGKLLSGQRAQRAQRQEEREEQNRIARVEKWIDQVQGQ
ncbi:hypothetical protein E4U43_002094 [Claviceps pusilla]|uniref:Myb-like domain-containing protein n=1 Tax=Claviceps pusilla TaxID=123648 RepID=A0A9P7SVG9_9HYPO|nr:hypothetical protein E4U43_002094 [Claviceps pusilla]